MALNQFTSDWNDSFELKISVGDIKKPTQTFLLEVLDFFLGTMHIDRDKLKAKMDERHYKIWLVNYYNDFFKSCNPKCYPFCYGDLLKPDSKKVLETLRFLLNFHLFFKAVHKEVVDTANNKIEMYNQSLSKKNQLQLHQEEAKIQSEKKEASLKETTRSIAEHKKLLEELAAKNAQLSNDADAAKQQLYRIKVENIDLKSQIEALKPNIVTESELEDHCKSIQKTDNAISELNAIEEDTRIKNECFLREMSRLNAEIEELSTNINESIILESAEKCRDKMKSLSELNNKVKKFQDQIENNIARREELLESIKSVDVQLSNKRNDLGSVLESCQAKIMKLESSCTRGSNQTASLERKLEVVEQQVEEFKDTQEELIAVGIQVVEYIADSEEPKGNQ